MATATETPQVLQDLERLIRDFAALREVEAALVEEALRIQATIDSGEALHHVHRWDFAARAELEGTLRIISRENGDCWHCHNLDPVQEMWEAHRLVEMAFASPNGADA
jgi:hypothetical protein